MNRFLRSCRVFGWYHRRLRHADLELMLPTLRLRARLQVGEWGGMSFERRQYQARRVTIRLWEDFIYREGREHWQCACAKAHPPKPEFV